MKKNNRKKPSSAVSLDANELSRVNGGALPVLALPSLDVLQSRIRLVDFTRLTNRFGWALGTKG
jgi:hypothetical protein